MQRALEARHPQQRRNTMADRDTGTQDTDKVKGTETQDQHGEGLLDEITGTVKDTVRDALGVVQGVLGTVQDTVGDVKDRL
jgi:uncharacterized protein YjbJ (UPF0337 family)